MDLHPAWGYVSGLFYGGYGMTNEPKKRGRPPKAPASEETEYHRGNFFIRLHYGLWHVFHGPSLLGTYRTKEEAEASLEP